MERFIEFAGNHWELFAALAVTVALIIKSHLGGRLSGYRTIPAGEAINLINQEGGIVLDVREQKEYSQGHIVDSIHIPLTAFKKRITELEKHRDKPIIVACRSGSRSGSACSQLTKQKFGQVYNLGGGIVSWQSANLPLTKK